MTELENIENYGGLGTNTEKHLEPGLFHYGLFDEGGDQIGYATNDAQGHFSFKDIPLYEPGIKTFSIRIIAPYPDGWVPTEVGSYQILSLVTADPDGELQYQLIPPDFKAVFTHVQSPNSVTLGGRLEIIDGCGNGSPAFGLFDPKGNLISTAFPNPGDGCFFFPTLTFHEPGTFSYMLGEIFPHKKGCNKKSPQKVRVTICCTDSEGGLVATPNVKASELVFIKQRRDRKKDA